MRTSVKQCLSLSILLLGSTSYALPSLSLFSDSQQPLQIKDDRSKWQKVTDKVFGLTSASSSSLQPLIPDALFDSKRPQQTAPKHILTKYGGDVVLRFNISTSEEAKSLSEAAETLLLDVWEYSENWVDIRLAIDIVAPLLGLLPKSLQHSHVPLLRERDLANAIFNTYPASAKEEMSHKNQHIEPERHRPSSLTTKPSNGAKNDVFFSDYQPLSVLETWMRLMSSLYSSHVRMIKIGQSGQGRDILALRIGVHPTNNHATDRPKRKTVLITGGVHAREWITTSTVTYLAYQFIVGYGRDEHLARLVQDFDFVLVPTLNPDGYVYTWDTDRLWRKNRQSTSIRFCPGIDIDRSFDFEWDGPAATMNSPCSESFAGDKPFAATEARQLAQWAKNQTTKNNVEFVGYLDLHAYSQQILYPYSYSCDSVPPGLENLEELAFGMQKAIRMSHGQVYEVLPACQGNVASAKTDKDKPSRLYPKMEASGGSALDWFYHTLKVRYTYQLKLRDRGSYGFLLPRDHIVPTGQETWDALLNLANFLSTKYSTDSTS